MFFFATPPHRQPSCTPAIIALSLTGLGACVSEAKLSGTPSEGGYCGGVAKKNIVGKMERVVERLQVL
jgi:hypothetical protein